MIELVDQHMVSRFTPIKMDGNPLTVYAPGAARPKGQTICPNVAISRYLPFDIDIKTSRPHIEVFTSSDEQQTVQIPEQFGHDLHAEVTASKQEPYQIVSGHDLIVFRVGTPGAWGPEDVIVLPPGTRTAWEIARACNYYATSIKVDCWNGALCIRTAKPGVDLEILEDAASAYDVLGLTPGVTSHLTRTGPAAWTWGPPPTPIKLYYQVDLIATEQAHANALLVMLLEALPCPYRPLIGDKHVLILPSGPPVNLDELEEPYFRTAARYSVSNVWIDRKGTFTKPSIRDVEVEVEA